MGGAGVGNVAFGCLRHDWGFLLFQGCIASRGWNIVEGWLLENTANFLPAFVEPEHVVRSFDCLYKVYFVPAAPLYLGPIALS